MKFRIDPKKPLDKTQWHLWFAWYPVRAGQFLHWLQFMSRKGVHHDDSMGGYWVFEYEEPTIYP